MEPAAGPEVGGQPPVRLDRGVRALPGVVELAQDAEVDEALGVGLPGRRGMEPIGVGHPVPDQDPPEALPLEGGGDGAVDRDHGRDGWLEGPDEAPRGLPVGDEHAAIGPPVQGGKGGDHPVPHVGQEEDGEPPSPQAGQDREGSEVAAGPGPGGGDRHRRAVGGPGPAPDRLLPGRMDAGRDVEAPGREVPEEVQVEDLHPPGGTGASTQQDLVDDEDGPLGHVSRGIAERGARILAVDP